MERRLLIPTVAAVHGSDLVWNQLTLYLVIHMKIQSQALAGQRENPALCLRKKGFACSGSAGVVYCTGTQSAFCPGLEGNEWRGNTFNLKWEGE